MNKVLLVADNAKLVQKAVEAKGFQFIWAENGKQGMELALEHVPDIILLDLGLPDIDGQTLSTWIRDERTLWKIPLVVITAWPEETARQMVRAYQLDGYIGKPFNLKNLWKILAKFVSE